MKQERDNIGQIYVPGIDESFELTAENLQQHVAAYEGLAFDAWREGRQ